MEPVLDCFSFFNELDLLEIRLNCLAPYVDRFVLVESPETHSGKLKPLVYSENKERFKDFPITHLVSPVCTAIRKNDVAGNAWRREHFQREYLRTEVDLIDGDSIILLSDVDEIPDLEHWDAVRLGVFRMKTYYYYLNLYGGHDLNCTTVEKREYFKSMNRLIHNRAIFPIIGRGWHFSTLGSAEDIRCKIESFAHTELHKPEFLDDIEHKRMMRIDPFKDGAPNWGERKYELTVEKLEGPKWLLENIYRYPHLLCS